MAQAVTKSLPVEGKWPLRAALCRFAAIMLVVILAVGWLTGCAIRRPAAPVQERPGLPEARRAPGDAPTSLPAKPDPLPLDGRFALRELNSSVAESQRIDLASQGIGSWTDLEQPLRNSLEFVRHRPQDEVALRRPDLALTWGQVRRSLETLISLLPRLDSEPELLGTTFAWLEIKPQPLMTSYYTPAIAASLTHRKGYDYPIYGVPQDLKCNLSYTGHGSKYYRVVNGKVLPYHNRRAVDMKGVLKGRGLEIAWVKDPVDLFYLHVEGAGLLRLPDGSTKRVLYASKNGRPFKSLGRILYDRGLLPAGRLGKSHVKEYFQKHPAKMLDYMSECESYVFFRLADSGAEGTIGRPLTPLVSMATDPTLVPLGGILVLNTEIPNGRGQEPRRITGLALAQDTGAAIRGFHMDYYLGEGDRVEYAAHNVKTRSIIHLLISKEALHDRNDTRDDNQPPAAVFQSADQSGGRMAPHGTGF